MTDGKLAMQKAKGFEKEKNDQIFGAIATTYAKHGTTTTMLFPRKPRKLLRLWPGYVYQLLWKISKTLC